MLNKNISIPFILIAMLLLAACVPSVSPEIVNIPVTSATQIPTATNSPTLISTQLSTQAPTPLSILCNQAMFIGDITIPDGSAIHSGNVFTKTWRLQNTGTCAWTPNYDLVYLSGDLMGGSTVRHLPRQVNPGDQIDLNVNLTAPASSGAYLGSWMLRDSHGTLFGIGAKADQPLLVRIVVQSTTTLFAVTKVVSWLNSSNYTGVCPATFMFYANIWTNGAGTVTYYWLRSDGSKSPQGALTLTSAGLQAIADTWTLGRAGLVTGGWDQVYIDQPNHQSFTPAYFNLACNPSAPAATRVPTKSPTLTSVPTPPLPTPPVPTPAPTLTSVPTPPAPTQPAPTQPAATQPPPTQPAPTQSVPDPPAPTQPAATQPAPIQAAPTQTSIPVSQGQPGNDPPPKLKIPGNPGKTKQHPPPKPKKSGNQHPNKH